MVSDWFERFLTSYVELMILVEGILAVSEMPLSSCSGAKYLKAGRARGHQ